MNDSAMIDQTGTDYTVVRIRCRTLDFARAMDIHDALLGASELDAPLLVVDLLEVNYVDGSGTAELLRAYQWMARRCGHLALVCTDQPIIRRWAIDGLDRVFSVFPSVVDAVAAEHAAGSR